MLRLLAETIHVWYIYLHLLYMKVDISVRWILWVQKMTSYLQGKCENISFVGEADTLIAQFKTADGQIYIYIYQHPDRLAWIFMLWMDKILSHLRRMIPYKSWDIYFSTGAGLCSSKAQRPIVPDLHVKPLLSCNMLSGFYIYPPGN